MIVPNVTQHTPFPYTPGVTGPSGTGPTTTPPASSATDTAASSSSPASPSATGSGDVFGELSGLVQQFLLQLQSHGSGGQDGGDQHGGDQDGGGQSKGTTLDTSGSGASSSIGVEGATPGKPAARSLFGTSAPAAPDSTGNTNGQASNDTMLSRIVSALQAYAANGAAGLSTS